MKRRSAVALLLALLMLFTGCADLLDPSFAEKIPAGAAPLRDLAAYENSVAAPEPGCIVDLGAYGYISNELVLVVDPSFTREQTQTLAAAYGFTVVGRVEAANTVQLRADRPYSPEELNALCDRLNAEDGVLFAGMHYLTALQGQTVAAAPAEGDAGWAAEALSIPWFRSEHADMQPQRVGVISTMFDASHGSISYAQLPDNDVYFETDKDRSEASAGTFTAGLIAGAAGEGYAGGVLTNGEIVGISCGTSGTLQSSVMTVSRLWTLLSYGIRIVDLDLGYASAFISKLTAGDPAALGAFRSDTAFFTAALSGLLANGYDLLLVCPGGTGDALHNSAFCAITDETVKAHILVVGAAAKKAEGYTVSSFTADCERLDMYAPGENVFGCVSRGAFGFMSGSGAAAAYVTGACAAIGLLHPGMDCADIAAWACESANNGVQGAAKGMIDLETAGVRRENYVDPPQTLFITVDHASTFVANEIIIITDTVYTKADAAAIGEKYGFRVVGYVEIANTTQLRTDRRYTLEQLQQICDEIMADYPDIVYFAGINYLRDPDASALPNDPWGGSPLEVGNAAGTNWGVEAINATWVWDNYPDIPTVRIGVLDSMFDAAHEDVPFVKTLYNLIFYDTDKEGTPGNHGTHVAGTIGAIHNNGIGISGVLPNCEIVGASVRGSYLDTISLVAELVTYGVKIINYSMGCDASYQKLLLGGDPYALEEFRTDVDATTQALYNILYNGYDFLIVSASGNDGDIGCIAFYNNSFCGVTDERIKDHILVVGATELLYSNNYGVAYFSNQGDRVDVMAPGVDILSTISLNRYESWDGTSMAAPHVAGACGVLQALFPEMSCTAIKEWIIRTADIYVAGTEKRMIDLRTAVENYTPGGLTEPEADPFYDGGGSRPTYVHASTDAARFFLFLCAENEGLDSGSHEYYVHYIDKTVTLRELFDRGVSPDEYVAISPVDGTGKPLRTDVIQILSYEPYGSRAYKIRYRVLCSGDVVYDKESEIREAVLSPDAWVWILHEEVCKFDSDTLEFDLDSDFIFETPVKVSDLRTFFNREGKGSVRLVADFKSTRHTAGGIRTWNDPNPRLMTMLGGFMGLRDANAYDLFEQLSK